MPGMGRVGDHMWEGYEMFEQRGGMGAQDEGEMVGGGRRR